MIQDYIKRIARAVSARGSRAVDLVRGEDPAGTGEYPASKPFYRDPKASSEQARKARDLMKEKGMRPLPYPFNHILSIVSDCDFSYPRNTWHALSRLNFDLNIDFGDSIMPFDMRRETRMANSSCTPSFGLGDHMFRTRDDLRQLLDVGLIDHVHGLWNPAPTGLIIEGASLEWLDASSAIAGNLEIRIRRLRQAIRKELDRRFVWTFPRTLLLDTKRCNQSPPSVTIHTAARRKIKLQHDGTLKLPNGSTRHEYSVSWPDPGKTIGSHILEKIHVEGVDTSPGGTDAIDRIALLTTDRRMHIDVLEELIDDASGRLRLFVDHSASGFLTEPSEQRHRNELDTMTAKAEIDGLVPCWLGHTRNGPGISMLPDDPASPMYLLDHMFKRGFRYFNPSGSSGEALDSIDPLEVVCPSNGRDGTPVRLVRRIMPRQHKGMLDPGLSDKVNRKSRITTFAPRLKTAILEARGNDSKAFPFYTHLGADLEWEDRDEQFHPDVMAELQDRIHNFSGTVGADERILCMRASDFYTYLHMAGDIAEHCTRHGENRIDIASWSDAHTGDRLPGTPSKLQCLTFKVESALEADVRLDGNPLPDLLRVGAHVGAPEEWVTLLSGGIRQRSPLPAAESGGPVSTRVATAPNVIGAVAYAGIEWQSDETRNGGMRGFTIASSKGLSLYIGSPELYEQIEPCTGTIFVEEWPESDTVCTWFSLATATWSVDMTSPLACFDDQVTMTSYSVDGARPPTALLLMKPALSSERTVDPVDYASFHAWRKHVQRTRCSIARTSNL
ncbi:MAG: hypothetical protein CMJ36_00260 [Phycisphaerae bacterium]|nr:hypothetical protein [Phycisphaerae bacterium]